MSDIVERLRGRAKQLDGQGDGLGYYSRMDVALDRDAADEIDRLREALERVVREWEAAPGLVYHQLRKYWLVETMAPTIDAARTALAKEAGK
jgi:hypothetical protein